MPIAMTAGYALGIGKPSAAAAVHALTGPSGAGNDGIVSGNTMSYNNSGFSTINGQVAANSLVSGTSGALTYAFGGTYGRGTTIAFYTGTNLTGTASFPSFFIGGSGTLTVPIGTQSIYLSGTTSGAPPFAFQSLAMSATLS
jgi:hypothetical protein